MAAAEKGNKDRMMAAHLVKQGYPHGKRKSSTLCPPDPIRNGPGSAAYRRRVAK